MSAVGARCLLLSLGSVLLGQQPLPEVAVHWAHAPLVRPTVPTAEHEGWVRDPIDAFIARKHVQHGLTPAPQASRRTLIRRLSFDLLGLPPLPEEVARYVSDASPRAYERLVDRLLASPHFGERQARHWLDLARFGESDGFEHDGPRPLAWRYRDWVVQAFRDDLPFDEFARRQIAGDALAPGDPSAAIATGFLVAGPWDRVGHTQFSAMRRAGARQDELHEIIGTTAQAFLGMTIHCARCHDHKTEPFRQLDYYRFAAALAGVGRGVREVTPATDERRRLEQRRADLRVELASIEEPVRRRLAAERGEPRPNFGWSAGSDRGAWTLGGGARVEQGALVLDGARAHAVSQPLLFDLQSKTIEVWMQLEDVAQFGGAIVSIAHDQGGVFDALMFGGTEPGRFGVGSEGLARTQSFGGPRQGAGRVHFAVAFAEDGTVTAYRDGLPYGTPYRVDWPVRFARGHARVLLGFPHGPGWRPPTGLPLLRARIERIAVHDSALTAALVRQSAHRPVDAILDVDVVRALASEPRARRGAVLRLLEQIEDRLNRGRAFGYCVQSSEPDPIRVLPRGQVGATGPLAEPGGVALPTLSPAFGLAADAADGERRKRLAAWITDPRNPVFARVAAHRFWGQLMGQGLVRTPSDFGRSTAEPTHPELLEWLAADFVDAGYRVKALIRRIVCSATYRQSGRGSDAARRIDPTNRWLARRQPKRLEAEAIRDAMLVASGRLDRTVGGPGYRDFEVRPRGPTYFYEPSLMERNADGTPLERPRRSLYRMWARGGRNRLFEAFDCPDPSVATPLRAVTTTPLQALALLNSRTALSLAHAMAQRLHELAPESPSAQLVWAYRLALGRPPDSVEKQRMEPLLRAHGLAVLARGLFNCSEFVHVH